MFSTIRFVVEFFNTAHAAQHGGHYSKTFDQVKSTDDHARVYVGKESHGAYHDQCKTKTTYVQKQFSKKKP